MTTARSRDSGLTSHAESQQQPAAERHTLSQLFSTTAGLWLLAELPSLAAEATPDFSQGSFSAGSYYVSLGLFLVSLPGMYPVPFVCCTCLHPCDIEHKAC